MSNYKKLTRHPKTGEWVEADWLDDYFGPHHYGVKFPDGTVEDLREVELETKDN